MLITSLGSSQPGHLWDWRTAHGSGRRQSCCVKSRSKRFSPARERYGTCPTPVGRCGPISTRCWNAVPGHSALRSTRPAQNIELFTILASLAPAPVADTERHHSANVNVGIVACEVCRRGLHV